MEEFRPSFQCGGKDRRLEIVSGKSFGANQTYTTSRPRSPLDLMHPVPPRVTRLSQSSAPASKPWAFNDPEMKRRKRIAKYKVYAIEGRVKNSIRNGLRWIRNNYSEIVHGF